MHGLTLGDISSENSRTYRDRVAVVCRADRYTFAALEERVNRLANALSSAGMGPGERVLWLGQNCHRVLELLLAAAKLGAMVCPINWRQSSDEMAFVVDDLAPKVVVWQNEAIGQTVRAARIAARHDAVWLQADGTTGGDDTYDDFLGRFPPVELGIVVPPAAPVLIIYTAAFSGRPNGSMITQTGLMTQNANLFKLADMWPGHVYLNCGPLFHIGTFMYTVATFHVGGTNVFCRRAEPQEVMELIARERCTGGMVLAPTIAQIIELNRDGSYDLSSFRSPIHMDGWTEMICPESSPFGARTMGGYGQTEVTGFPVYAAFGGRAGVSTAGAPSPWCRVRIVDDDGKEVPDGQVGEIVFRGPLVHAGYWNRPELNRERMRTGGWHTSDLGRRENDGVISFIGPKTQMIKSGVENIYPGEVEACIERLRGVKEAAIIGVPDPRFIQSVKAIVAIEDGTSLDADHVIAHCLANIASYKKPKTVEFVDALPRNAAGGKDYLALDERFGGGGYPGGRTRSQ